MLSSMPNEGALECGGGGGFFGLGAIPIPRTGENSASLIPIAIGGGGGWTSSWAARRVLAAGTVEFMLKLNLA